ncbi:MAG: helix-turn-helix domain-containing protein [Candidatus Omnitrophota bacterium]|nr:helix-turn-helix domain-containing protein [Candidatus Omnitrophota bacterium]
MISKKQLQQLYIDKKLSMMEIAAKLGITHATIYYWLKKYKIKRRSWRDSAYVQHNPDGDHFKIKKKLSEGEKGLLMCGLMLYCGEGNRSNKHSIQLANLDHRILKVFMGFLRKVCGISKNKVSLYVQLYKKFNRNEALEYWSKTLLIPKSQIGIYPHTDKRSKFAEQRSKFGIARIQFHNYKLKDWIERQADYYLDKFS